jgi:hypothetical protein
LEEINLPDELIDSLCGQPVRIEILPEEATNNSLRPPRYLVVAHDCGKRICQLPRRWIAPLSVEPPLDPFCGVSRDIEFQEWLCPPSCWDLLDINLPDHIAVAATQNAMIVRVQLSPDKPVRVLWQDREGGVWRLPFDWRRRRVMLPTTKTLLAQGVPSDVAERFGGGIVSLNYHPGSLCCLPDAYRFRDGEGGKWPVKIKDCTLVGFGDEAEHRI